MARLLHSLVAIAFIGLTNANTVSTTTSTSPALPSGIEVDIIFPVHNATYNITKSLPIAFALQNVKAATALGPFSFSWDIMAWGDVGSNNQAPGGVINDNGGVSFDPGQNITDPYILVAQTDVQNWQYGPRFPWGSVYGLQWFLTWNNSGVCDSAYYGTSGQLFFNVDKNASEPDLNNVTGKCPQIGTVFEITETYINSSCSAIVNNTMNGSPCAVKVDNAMVTSISSTVQSLITASASASSASAASVSAEFATPTPTHHNSAIRFAIPIGELLAATFILVCVELIVL